MIIVFDMGGTNLRVGASRDGKKIFQQIKFATPRTFSAVVRELGNAAKLLAGKNKINLVVGGVPGALNRAHTALVCAPHVPDLENKNLAAALRKILKAPVILENDAALVGLGEAYAAKLNKKVVAYIGVGTGVGGARIVNGALDAAPLGFEPGHQIIFSDQNNLKKYRDLEQLISGSEMRARFKKSPEKIKSARVWDEAAQILAIALHNTTLYWSPDVIVLGGSMITGHPGISPARVRAHLAKIKKMFDQSPKILVAKLGDAGGLHGALIRARA